MGSRVLDNTSHIYSKVDRRLMNLSLNFGDSNISFDRVIEQLNRFKLLPQLIQEIATDDLVAEMAIACSIDEEDRELRLQQFKLAKWGDEVESYFQAHGGGLDRVLLSILQVKDPALAQELFFRIQSGEVSFAETALDYSQGMHAQNGGILGPLLWENLAPGIRQIIEKLEPGELSPLFQLDGFYTFLRLDEREPAELDDLRHQFLLDRLFSNWLESQLSR
jgi:parvulin-like peptidyl-prolyl isomerase